MNRKIIGISGKSGAGKSARNYAHQLLRHFPRDHGVKDSYLLGRVVQIAEASPMESFASTDVGRLMAFVKPDGQVPSDHYFDKWCDWLTSIDVPWVIVRSLLNPPILYKERRI